MKKIIAAAAGLAMVGTMATTAFAVESQFGGYFRTRAYTQLDFDGKDSGSVSLTDARTRLYYTAVFSENLKFVNKFEFDTDFGGDDTGDIGADGDTGEWEIKNSYVDFTTGPVRYKVGTQGATISRGFVFADDGSGVYAGANAGDMALMQVLWLSVNEDDVTANGPTDDEADIYAFVPVLTLSDSLSVTPHLTYVNTEGSDNDYWFLGADVDFSADGMSVWGTAIYNGGEINDGADDVEAWLLAAGGSFGMFHAEAFYATGDDDPTDGDSEAFGAAATDPVTGATTAFVPGNSYYWAEIMGYGIFDNTVSSGAPADNISNILAVNFGVKTKVAEKLTIGGDIWWAQLAEDDANGEDDLGVEVDLKATYMIMDNLNLDLVAAYLFAGDATSDDGNNEEDPIEVGARISLSF